MDKSSALCLIIIIAAIFVLFLLISFFVLKQLNKVKKAQDKLFYIFGDQNAIEAVVHLAEENEQQRRELHQQRQALAALEEKQKACFDRINIVRYYAAGESEAKMSYSVGLSNQKEDGLVITGLHYRTGVNLYFKEIHEGVGDYPLSAEEKEAVSRNHVSKVRN